MCKVTEQRAAASCPYVIVFVPTHTELNKECAFTQARVCCMLEKAGGDKG